MADQSMRLNLIMGMVDKITAPVQKVTNQTTRMADEVKKSQQELARLGGMSKDIEHFRKLKQGAVQTETALQQAQEKVARLSQEMNASGNPTRKMTAEFNRATKEVKKLQAQQQSERAELQQLRGRMNEAGVSTKNLNDATRKIREETARYNSQLEQQQQQLADVAKQQQKTAELTQRNKDMRMSAGVDAVGVSAAVFGIKKLVDAYGEISSAQGEIQSLGIDEAGIASITAKAKAFSNEWAGTTQAEFIRASYDIKSGISTLSDAAVGEMTRIAALTAGATKSTTAQMTSLFASGYGIYRKQFDQFGAQVIDGWEELSAAERDMKFGEYFSAGIASSVQAFKTDGANMSAAISNLGAAATSANVPFAEQLSILGQLQSTMSGSEAATKYRAFLGNAAKAADKLGLEFLDANDNLRSMPEILEELRGKYGDTIDALEEKEIKDAFGTDEAVAMIKLLYPEIDTLKGNINGMNDSLAGGMDKTTQMAKAILTGPAESFQLLNQRVSNATASVGKAFAPTMVFAAGVIGNFANGLADLMEQFPLLSNTIAIGVTALIGFKVASIAARFAYATFSDALIFGRKVMAALTLTNIKSNAVLAVSKVRMVAAVAATWALTGAQKAQAAGTAVVTAAQWAWNAAMMANPIGLVIAGIMALIAIVAVIIKYWEPISGFFAGLWDGVKAVFASGWEFIKTVLSFTPLGLIMQAWEPLTEFFGGLWDGIKSVFAGALEFITGSVLAPINAVKETLGGWWDSLFGDDEKSVDVNQKVKQISEQVPAGDGSDSPGGVVSAGRVQIAPVGGGVAASSSVPGGTSITNDYGGITIQASEGMDEKALAREVRRQLDERDRAAAQRHRGRLYD
ncbi:phage tail tape measure protein [Vibrio owensii]|uniref:phage tail tape measure protein n=1 Tax=Vibrio owensii TaxID=696485 RepID=UPI00374A275F